VRANLADSSDQNPDRGLPLAQVPLLASHVGGFQPMSRESQLTPGQKIA
jgi:hypothetical protein